MTRIENNGYPTVSIEYFPPKTLSSERALMTGAHALRRFEPSFQTITFGAGGSVAEGTLDWALRLQVLNEVPTACHIALNHFNRDSLIEFAGHLWTNDITRLVVLRGDAISEGGEELPGFGSVAGAIEALLKEYPFDISVSAYPEVHPRAVDLAGDIDVLLAKQDAGAKRAITQYFFDNNDFYRFRELAEKRGFNKELVPGVIPITNFAKIKEFSEKCGANIPGQFDAVFAKAGDDKAMHTNIAREIIEIQVKDLAQNDVTSLHVYSLNRVDLTADTIRAFQSQFERDIEEFRPALVG